MDDQTQQTGQVKLEDLDLFTLLRLDHLSAENKARHLAEIQQVVLTDFLQEDLPGMLSEEDAEEYKKLAQEPGDGEALENFLREKIPNFDQIMIAKMLEAKKALVRENMLTRVDITKQALEDPEVQKDEEKKKSFEEEKGKLDKIVASIDSDDWGQASSLIASL